MAIKVNQVFGKLKPTRKPKPAVGVAQPGPVAVLPQPTVRQDAPATRPPQPVTFTPYQPPATPPPDVGWQDPTYLNTTSNIQTGLDNLKGYLVNAGTALGQDYGISFDRDPNNPLVGTNFHIDPNVDVSNPYSRAALLKRTHDAHVRGNTNSYAAGGQLYSGALQNAQNTEGFQFGAGQNQLLSGFQQTFGGLLQQWLNANTTATGQSLQAQADAIARHSNDPATPPPAFTGGAAAPGSNPYVATGSVPAGTQPKEYVSPAVRNYLAAGRRAKPGRSKSPKKGPGRTGGAYAP